MKVAYLGSPGLYGLFTAFRNLRAGLEGQDFDLRWVGHGQWAADSLNELKWESERSSGEVVGPESKDFEFLGKSLVGHLVEKKYEAVFLNIPQNASELNAARYLPKNIIRVLLVHGMGKGIYRMCTGIREHVHATIGMSPRVRDDLIEGFGFDAKRTMGGAGIDLGPFGNLPARGESESLRLLYFGRISDAIKGVFHLPTIMGGLAGEKVELEIAGDGPDLAELKRRCSGLGDRVRFLGAVASQEIPKLVARRDVLIFPTRGEGLGYVLLEAMAAGCVPVSSRIRGVTDHVVKDGESGFLFAIDDAAAATQWVAKLARDRKLLATMSATGKADCAQRFDAKVIGKRNGELLRSLKESPPAIAEPLDLGKWDYPKEFKRGWRGLVPKGVKRVVLGWMGRR